MTTNVAAEEVTESKAATAVKQQIIWRNVVLLTVIHLLALYAAVVVLPRVKLITLIWHFVYGYFGLLGVTAGVHRYWTHKTYGAKLPLRIILLVLYCAAGLSHILQWVRDHRVHHKFSETDADPHDSRRGFFFSHIGWLMQKKHPEVLRRGKQIDMSDVLADPVVQFEERYFVPLVLIFTFLLPTTVPCLLWGETWWNSTFGTIFRWVLTMNVVFSTNSFAHLYGIHPFNRKINPAENKVVSFITLGIGWPKYHHTFPWDYKIGELGHYRSNWTKAFIDFFAYIGWAYDVKQPSKELVKRVAEKFGDESLTKWGDVEEVPEENEHRLVGKQNVEEMLLEAEEKYKGI